MDFVEEKRAAVGSLELAGTRLDAGECTASHAKEAPDCVVLACEEGPILRMELSFDTKLAVDAIETRRCELLASAGLTLEKDRAAGPRSNAEAVFDFGGVESAGNEALLVFPTGGSDRAEVGDDRKEAPPRANDVTVGCSMTPVDFRAVEVEPVAAPEITDLERVAVRSDREMTARELLVTNAPRAPRAPAHRDLLLDMGSVIGSEPSGLPHEQKPGPWLTMLHSGMFGRSGESRRVRQD